MKFVKAMGAVGVLSLLLAGTAGAHAAGTYAFTCTGVKSETFTIALTGFTVKLNGVDDAASSGAGAKRGSFSVTIRFAPGKDYEALWSMAQDNEVLRSCKLTDSEGASGVTASDDWTASTSKKSKSKTNAQPVPSSGGALEWILTNATVSSVTAIGRESTTGAAGGEMEATIDAQQITFTM
jgi:hypothetical protein